MQQKPKKKLKKNKESLKGWAKYSNMAFQMLAIILLGVFGGLKLDKYIDIEFPIFTVILTPISVILAIYYVIKDLINIK